MPRPYVPILARMLTMRTPVGPIAYDCVKVVVVHSGSALLSGDFGEESVGGGDVVVLSTNTVCTGSPREPIVATVLYLDTDYLTDQVFWRHSSVFSDRLAVRHFLKANYGHTIQILHLGREGALHLEPWLDEMVKLGDAVDFSTAFFRLQSLLFAVLDDLAPCASEKPVQLPGARRARASLTQPRNRPFRPIRPEAAAARDAMQGAINDRWTLGTLAQHVHLSPSQLSRVFCDAFGKTPLAYLTMLRIEEMARLLRETDLSVSVAARRVGWHSRSHAAKVFRRCVGVSPHQYRDRYSPKSKTR